MVCSSGIDLGELNAVRLLIEELETEPKALDSLTWFGTYPSTYCCYNG